MVETCWVVWRRRVSPRAMMADGGDGVTTHSEQAIGNGAG